MTDVRRAGRHAPGRYGRNPKTELLRAVAERRAAKRDPFARANTQVRYLRPDQIPTIQDMDMEDE